jgi:hypothetical protein
MNKKNIFDDDSMWIDNSTYILHDRDANPAEHYHLLPDGCKVISGVALCAGMTVLVTVFAVASIKVGEESDYIDSKKDKDLPSSISAHNLHNPLLDHDNDVSQSLA